MNWLNSIRAADKTAITENGNRKVHYKFQDGTEMAEEYNLETNVLVRRAWKQSNNITKKPSWVTEVGDPEPKSLLLDNSGIQEAQNSPYMLKRITRDNIEWRIRNLPYPLEVYSVTAAPEQKCLIVRTTNKKYYKKIEVQELERCGILPEQKNISFTHKFNTLIITYKKPPQVLKMERDVLHELKNVKNIDNSELPSCNPS
ncbi:protein DPCD isoform X2 [Cimex lectularius]|uniref:Protein DPCD n=1 Tax=Cimex lectularius TaxID=79782 RepID=A0A8I6TD26_CIMLE|nr:protein DPCD isoform X2 [Cimex lectularius]